MSEIEPHVLIQKRAWARIQAVRVAAEKAREASK